MTASTANNLRKADALRQELQHLKANRPMFQNVRQMSPEEFSTSRAALEDWIMRIGKLEVDISLAESPDTSKCADWRSEKMSLARVCME